MTTADDLPDDVVERAREVLRFVSNTYTRSRLAALLDAGIVALVPDPDEAAVEALDEATGRRGTSDTPAGYLARLNTAGWTVARLTDVHPDWRERGEDDYDAGFRDATSHYDMHNEPCPDPGLHDVQRRESVEGTVWCEQCQDFHHAPDIPNDCGPHLPVFVGGEPVQRREPCEECDGDGGHNRPDTDPHALVTCPTCKGSGERPADPQHDHDPGECDDCRLLHQCVECVAYVGHVLNPASERDAEAVRAFTRALRIASHASEIVVRFEEACDPVVVLIDGEPVTPGPEPRSDEFVYPEPHVCNVVRSLARLARPTAGHLDPTALARAVATHQARTDTAPLRYDFERGPF